MSVSLSMILAGLALVSFAAYGDPPLFTPAPAAGSRARVQSRESSAVAPLSPVNVKATKKLVETLEQVKVALKRPFDPSPKLVDQMVCQLHGGMQPVLECGTQGWYTMRRDATQMALETGMPNPAVPQLGHPWHSVRAMSYRQRLVFRKLLNGLPPPGKGEVKVVDASGKVIATVGKSQSASGSQGKQ